MERFYKSNRASSVKRDAVIMVDSGSWKQPQTISLDALNDVLQFNEMDMSKFIDKSSIILDPSTLKIKMGFQHVVPSSVTRVNFKDQHIYPNLPPDVSPVDTTLHLATDLNYLYVWVESSNRWKRIALAEF
jgi:hypothetical protein